MKKIVLVLMVIVLIAACAPLASASSVESKASTQSLVDYLDTVYNKYSNNSTFDYLFRTYTTSTRCNLGILSRINAQKHLKHNIPYDTLLYPKGTPVFLVEQHKSPMDSVLYGTRNLRYNGCELIAVHNVLLELGKYKPMSQIIYDFESVGAIWLEGEFGTKIMQYNAYLKKQGVKTQEFRTVKQLDDARKDGDVFILTYRWMTDIGIHTIMVKQTDGRLMTYNNGGDALYDSFAQLIDLNGPFLMATRIAA